MADSFILVLNKRWKTAQPQADSVLLKIIEVQAQCKNFINENSGVLSLIFFRMADWFGLGANVISYARELTAERNNCLNFYPSIIAWTGIRIRHLFTSCQAGVHLLKIVLYIVFNQNDQNLLWYEGIPPILLIHILACLCVYKYKNVYKCLCLSVYNYLYVCACMNTCVGMRVCEHMCGHMCMRALICDRAVWEYVEKPSSYFINMQPRFNFDIFIPI